MATGSVSKWARLRAAADHFFQEKGIESADTFARSRLHRFAHFCLLVARNFQRNRCPVRAASLAYTTLLALVPLLAVVVSITTSILQRQGEAPIAKLIDRMVEYVAPALDLQAAAPMPGIESDSAATLDDLPSGALENDNLLAQWLEEDGEFVASPPQDLPESALTDDQQLLAWLDAGGEFIPAPLSKSVSAYHDLPPAALTNDQVLLAWLEAGGEFVRPQSGRENVVGQITAFIGRINTGTLTITGTIALLFVGISLLRTIEAAFNDIWGVTQGRSFVKSVIYYWAVITLGPIVLVGAIALTTSSQTAKWQAYLEKVPFLPTIIAMVLPAVILTFGFAVFYALMPNTRVNWRAALLGGAVGGCLWQANNLLSVIYVGKVVSYTSIYGSLGAFPLFLVGLYFSWLIVLLGAQVAYAYQNRGAYIEERQAEMVNQRGRDFIALRLMTMISHRFLHGEKPATLHEISCGLSVPSALVSKLVTTLVKSGLLLEVSDNEIGYAPGRPLNHLTAHDVLRALRSGQGIELATKEDAWRTPVRSEFEKIVDAERQAGQTVTLEMLAQNRGEVARAIT